MPVLKKEIELDNGKKVWVRQASGMDKLKIEKVQAMTLRKCRHFGSDPAEWTSEQQEEFAMMLDEAGGGLEDQIQEWLPKCVISDDIDVSLLTSEEIMTLLNFVRGDDLEGAVPLE
jgi:hypothetical protein